MKLDKRLLFTALLCLWIVLETYLTVVIPQYQSIFYDGLSAKNLEQFYHGLYLLGFVYLGFTFGLPSKVWLTSRIAQAWRWSVTERFLGKNVTHITNVDGRIAEDIRIYTDIAVRVSTEIIIAILCLVGLLGSLWADKQLFLYCLGYIIILMVLTKLFKRPMQSAKFNQQESEQSYRAELLLTKNDLSIDATQVQSVTAASKRVFNVVFLFNMFYQVKNRASLLLIPLMLLTPYFAGTITLGMVMAKLSLFGLVVENATIVTVYYPELIAASASYKRVKELL